MIVSCTRDSGLDSRGLVRFVLIKRPYMSDLLSPRTDSLNRHGLVRWMMQGSLVQMALA